MAALAEFITFALVTTLVGAVVVKAAPVFATEVLATTGVVVSPQAANRINNATKANRDKLNLFTKRSFRSIGVATTKSEVND